ncbi:hypothetical protein [Silvibacterium dinghuense]|uniref:Uncharacterized protein n=1 Tax=Silvibacterium dinghuense TaxID=1560006 RepID=A0A4Q1SD23_9BACT|nr:hypothetical protein [Silvibacterium dinghuense]RXS95116.1 hypothetical protein ESZ00_10920 [Silvibacterium dinghuense]GGH10774.1 hypothetical protein GCM10011586_29260 [Silvibacterium dinghuense]
MAILHGLAPNRKISHKYPIYINLRSTPLSHRVAPIWKFTFELINGEYNWFYQFLRLPLLKLEGRELVGTGDKLLLPQDNKRDRVTATGDFQRGIGPVSGEFYVYDRDRDFLRLLTESKLVTDYLDENGGR